MQSKRNQKLIAFLKKQFAEGRHHHAYLFSGPEGIGKSKFVSDFFYFLSCEGKNKPCFECLKCKNLKAGIHPFVLNIYPESAGKTAASTISIKKIQELNHFLSLTAPAGYLKLAGIYDAQFLTIEAQNALLKILEEPSDNSIIFLTADHSQNLLSTVVSRTQSLKFTPTPNLDILEYLSSHNINEGEYFAVSAAGKPQILKKLLEDPEQNLTQIKNQLNLIQKIADVPLYKRLKLSEKLSQNPESAHTFLKLFKNFLYIKLKKLLSKDNKTGETYKNLVQKLHLIKNSQSALQKGINPKLVLENFFLNL